MDIEYHPIGIIHTPFEDPAGMPIQPRFAEGAGGHVEVFEEYADGIVDLEGFSHLHLIYHLHRSSGFSLRVTPYLDDHERGLFATRAPCRPNPVGLSVVRLTGVEGNRLRIKDVDMLDGTPLLDIKPFNPAIDHRERCRVGWMESKMEATGRGVSDGRFVEGADR
jgi:tRNA-Thr(GGU) m(6)t(6)A37 methyltransferase TsaA